MENGRREVLVVIEERDPSLDRLAAAGRSAMPQAAAEMADTSASAADMPASPDPAAEYGSAIDGAAEEVQQTMLALHEDRIRRTDLAIMAYQQSVTVAAADARRAVTRSRVALSIAAVMMVALFLGATWATHRVTRASAEVSHLADNVRQLTDTVGVKSLEIKELRHDSQAAKVSAARAEGELTAAKRQVDQLIQDREAERARLSGHVMMADVAAASATTQPAAAAGAATQPLLSDTRAILPTATTRPVEP
jgi:outer membrane murein-binding lipoprotein Lpp